VILNSLRRSLLKLHGQHFSVQGFNKLGYRGKPVGFEIFSGGAELSRLRREGLCFADVGDYFNSQGLVHKGKRFNRSSGIGVAD
jgi:hypothetical protein